MLHEATFMKDLKCNAWYYLQRYADDIEGWQTQMLCKTWPALPRPSQIPESFLHAPLLASMCFAPNCPKSGSSLKTDSGKGSCFESPRARSVCEFPSPLPCHHHWCKSACPILIKLQSSLWGQTGQHISRKHTPTWLFPFPVLTSPVLSFLTP